MDKSGGEGLNDWLHAPGSTRGLFQRLPTGMADEHPSRKFDPQHALPQGLPVHRSLRYDPLGVLFRSDKSMSSCSRRDLLGFNLKTTRPVLVCVYLRGGADGLNLIIPHGDPHYYALRPTIGIARPGAPGVDTTQTALDLDQFFGLHPALSALLPIWQAKEFAVVHAIGSDDQTRSHFEAQDRMEHAGPDGDSVTSGWLARHLSTRPGPSPTGLTAVALGTSAPESLRGTPAAVLASLEDYDLGDTQDPAFRQALTALYAPHSHARTDLQRAGLDALENLTRIDTLRSNTTQTSTAYPNTGFGRQLREIARLIQAGCGLEVACVDLGNWDTHILQESLLPGLAQTLAEGLAAFRADLDALWEHTTVLVMTEFGRRAYENTSLGTDHGRGSVLLALGGQVSGGQVITEWPTLGTADSEGVRDLAVTIDYRDILAEVVCTGLGNPNLDQVLPKWHPTFRGVLR